jgi:hypothetical protein
MPDCVLLPLTENCHLALRAKLQQFKGALWLICHGDSMFDFGYTPYSNGGG